MLQTLLALSKLAALASDDPPDDIHSNIEGQLGKKICNMVLRHFFLQNDAGSRLFILVTVFNKML